MRATMLVAALVLSAWARPTVAAAVEWSYAESGADPERRVLVHAREARAASPVVVHYGDAAAAYAETLAARGYLLAEVRVPEGPAAIDDAASALAAIAQRIVGHGGDPERLHLSADAALAPLVARLAESYERRTMRRVPREYVRGVVLAGGTAYEPPSHGASVPPTLLLYAAAGSEAAAAAERHAARLRAAGSRAQSAAVRDVGGADTARAAWFDTVAIDRVPRYEQLSFGPAVPRPGAMLVAHDGALWQGDAAAAVVHVQRNAGGPWSIAHRFERWERIAGLVGGDGVAPCAVLARAAGGGGISCLDADGEWGRARALPFAPGRVVSFARASGGAWLAGGTRIVRIDAARVTPAYDAPGEVVALASVDGVLHAAVAGPHAGIYAARVDALERIAVTEADALAAVPDPDGGGHEVLLAATLAGIERYDPRHGHARHVELDAAREFAALGALGARAPGARFAALPHPGTHDLVHAIPLPLSHRDPALAGAYYLVRQLDGSYAYGLARDLSTPHAAAPARLESIVASPWGDGAIEVAGRDASGAALLARGTFIDAPVREGLWWDRTKPGHGLALHPTGPRWVAMLYTHDADGAPAWYLAVGDIEGGTFGSDSNGLSRYRRPHGAAAPVRDASRSGAIELRFTGAASTEACRSAERRGAAALAWLAIEIEGRRAEACLEPIEFGPRGLPAVDTTGLWQAGDSDRSWGVALAPQGHDGWTREAALVWYHDATGEPRWAFGAAEAHAGDALIALSRRTGACLGCAPREARSEVVGSFSHRLRGFCGRVEGSATVLLGEPGPGGGYLVRRNAPLARLSAPRCY